MPGRPTKQARQRLSCRVEQRRPVAERYASEATSYLLWSKRSRSSGKRPGCRVRRVGAFLNNCLAEGSGRCRRQGVAGATGLPVSEDAHRLRARRQGTTNRPARTGLQAIGHSPRHSDGQPDFVLPWREFERAPSEEADRRGLFVAKASDEESFPVEVVQALTAAPDRVFCGIGDDAATRRREGRHPPDLSLADRARTAAGFDEDVGGHRSRSERRAGRPDSLRGRAFDVRFFFDWLRLLGSNQRPAD